MNGLRTLAIVVGTLILVHCSDPVVVPDPFPTAYDGARFDTDLLATQWYDCATWCIEQHSTFADPIAARVYAYMGIALYQSLVHGMPGYRSLEGQVAGLQDLPRPDTAGKRYYWVLVANAAIAELLRGMFPRSSHEVFRRIDALESANVAERWLVERDTAMLERSVAYGKEIAHRLLDIARQDGGDKAWESLFSPAAVLPPIPGGWRPTTSEYPHPLLPQWGAVRLLVVQDTAIDPPPPYAIEPGSLYRTAADSLYRRVKRATELDLDVARYWINSFGRPPTFPGHLMRIATRLIRTGPYRMGFGAVVYLQLGIAMHDAYVLTWRAKYRYPLARPETYIRDNIDRTYRPPLPSPPTPEYVSERAVVSTTVLRLLQHAFREPYPMIERISDRTHVERGMLERDWGSLTALWEEIIAADRWSGMHYDFSIAVGIQLGERISRQIQERLRVQ
ncbi:MAG: hypothetical protein NZ481_04795 [Candidatus Kapabacteria bacterium]|nr:hypothetical protein [Candidatus Kapabacteria bacterium]